MFVSSWLSIANNIKLLKSYANECPYRVLVKNPVKEMFIGKEKKKKKPINGLTVFFLFPIKVMSKFFLTGLLTSALRAFVSISHC